MLRVGLAIRPGVMGRGGHPTGSSGAFGAATTASKLLGLDTLTTAYALSSAGTNIVGLSEIPAEGRGHLKRTLRRRRRRGRDPGRAAGGGRPDRAADNSRPRGDLGLVHRLFRRG